MKATEYTNKELVEIYKNLKTSAKILGFSSASDSEMIVEIELEAAKRHLNLVDGTVEETAERQTVETTEQAQAEENKDTFEYRNYIISGNERTGIIAIDNHGNFSPKVYKTVEEAKKAVDEDIEYAEKKYAEIEAEQTEIEETAELETETNETTVETVKKTEKAEEEIITMANTNTNASIAKAEEKKTQFDFYNVTIGFEVEKFIGTIPADYESFGIYSDYEKAVQAAQAAADKYGAGNIYFHTVEIATRNDREVYDRDDYEDFIEERETIRHNWYTLTIVDTGKREHVNLDKPVRLDFEE